jgi:small-conductance mechanosensitive channel
VTGSAARAHPLSEDRQVVWLRRIFLTVVTTSSLALVPWVVYLAASLPNRQVSEQWNAAWVGFDIFLVLGLGYTAWNAWRRCQMLVPSALVTATLLVCDAWFDIVLDWGTSHVVISILTALVAELPLAALLLHVAFRVLRAMQRVTWKELGHDDEPPSLGRCSIAELLASDRRE